MICVPHGGKKAQMLSPKIQHEPIDIDRDEMLNEIGPEVLLSMYEKMVRTRTFDEKIKEMLKKGYSISEHSTLGQEAGPIGACAALREGDYVMPYHRGWAWAFGKGMESKPLLAELLGKKTGYCKGKGGPHLASYELGILGRPGVQAAHIPIAAGVGLAIRQQKRDSVCVAFFGNGASTNGNFHEALNLAGVWKSPTLFFCENNMYQIFCTMEETNSAVDIADKAVGYRIKGYIVDGNDAALIYHIVKKAVAGMRNGEGPVLIETKTYRWDGHNPIDKYHQGGYRTVEELEEWKKKCPIALMETDLLRLNLLTESKIAEIKADAVKEMDEAAEFAINSPYPEKEEYYADVYAE